jgi:gliding motility-associated lipoprotein GldH
MKKVIFILCVNILLFICSCDNSHYLLRENLYTENETWVVKDKIPFHFTVTDTLKVYKIGLNIRYTNAYPQQNIYVFLHTVFPNGMHAHDTISIDLFSLEGRPLGEGKRVIELQKYFSRVRFPMSGEYTMILEQAMRMDTLQGIISMGLYITEFKI